MIVSEHSYWAIRSTKIWLTSQDRWDVPRTIDLVRSLIVKVYPAPLGLNCIYMYVFHCLPAEAMARRKTVLKVRCLREASRNGTQGGLLKTSSIMSRFHCGRTGVILGLCNSTDVIMSDIVLA